ncbi:hypothetical protein Mapa_016490 [Marchantia paleacea]|nr:hypothetical protein Mapa_016490 [Marchantia paleacea]
MYAQTWRRHSGRLQADFLGYARDLIPGLRGNATSTKSWTKFLSSSVKGSQIQTKQARQRINRHDLPVSADRRTNCDVKSCISKGKVFERESNGISQYHKPNFDSVPQGFWNIPPYLVCRNSMRESSTAKINILRSPSTFLRYVSGGDRDGKGNNARQQTTPLPDGEGDENEKDEEHVLSMKDGGDGGAGKSSRVSSELIGGADHRGENHEQAVELRADGSNFREEDRERGMSDETDGEVLFWAHKTRFIMDFESRVVDWKSLDVDLTQFPFYLSESTRDSLVDCIAAHLRQPTFAGYGSGLPSSSRRIMLRGPAGTEVYQEKLVEAVAHYLQASLLVLDSTALSPHDYGDQESSSESDEDDNEDSQYAGDWNDYKWRENECKEGSTGEENEDTDVDAEVEKPSDEKIYSKLPVVTLLGVTAESAEAIRRKLLEKAGADAQQEENLDAQTDFSVKKGDRVKYIGESKFSADSVNRCSYENEQATTSGRDSTGRQVLKAGQRGRVVLVPKHMSGKVGVKFDKSEGRSDDALKDEKNSENAEKGHDLIEWCDLTDLEPDDGPVTAHTEWLAAVDSLCEVASTSRPLIIYLPDPQLWFERAVSVEQRQEFLMQLEHKLDLLEGPVVIIAGRTNEDQSEIDDRDRLKAHLEYIRQRLNLKATTKYFKLKELLGAGDIYEIFVNTVNIVPPQEDQALANWNAQIALHKEISQARWNHRLLEKILELHNMECSDVSEVDSHGLRLTNSKAENVVGWARNHHLGSCASTPPTNNGKLMIPRDSLERALTRLRENDSKKAQPVTKDFKTVAEDEYEKALISAVIPPNEVGVKFDHIGSLENVKQALKELVMLPLQRPELFAKGNLTRPCKGVLLFGPPGTGKTLLAKAVATEAGANFINITGSTITSKWFGDAEKLTKALFSLAKKLSPAVIFVDEVDSLLGARGGSSEHEATRKTRNEFMAAWDGLRSKDNERVLVLAATNRPFDLDDAVIRRLPRRILVDLPTAENRVKILRVILAEEDLEPNFNFNELAQMTEGYSGSDLKNLSIAAAYRPIRELLDAEQKEQEAVPVSAEGEGRRPLLSRSSSTAVIRALRLSDFREAMNQVGASIAYDASSMNELRRWNEQYGEGGNRRKSTFGFAV